MSKTVRKHRDTRIGIVLPGFGAESKELRIILDLIITSDYRYDSYKTTGENLKPADVTATLILPSDVAEKTAKKALGEARIIADAVHAVRDLGNAPSNDLTPTELAERARRLAKDAGVKCTVYNKAAIEKMKMGGLLAVNSGSVEEPRFVVMEYSPKNAKKTVCLVGKGITFDSGGISIKPADRMEEMKFDMCGAAAVTGIVTAAARLDLPVRVIALFVSTENLPSGSAYKPGDIIRMMSGKTVEIVNTDAEGRMILADALHYARNYEPDHLIDYATLTGACVVALGHETTGLFSNDRKLAQKLIESGDRVGERLWELPEWDEYKEYIKSEWADMKNSGGRWGGAISAAMFLKEFVDCPSWAHFDIAGTAWTEHETPREPKGATGVGVRATIDFLESLR
jgi:leucyl aminopeptidase